MSDATLFAVPVVSAIIPTRNRPRLVMRAVASALAQDYPALEVVVVIDGPDEETERVIRSIDDERLRVEILERPFGACGARNSGVRLATGQWVAFLDDDDEWLPHKISAQMRAALQSGIRQPVVSSQLFVRTQGHVHVWPRRAPYHPLSEYLFTRHSLSYGEGVLSTITLLMPRLLALEVPFAVAMAKYQDFDWILRASSRSDVQVVFVPEPLAIWHMAEWRASVSTADDWRYALHWLREHRNYLTRRAYAGFVATQIAPQAMRQGALSSFLPLLWAVFRSGSPSLYTLFLFLAMWISPKPLRRWARGGAQSAQPQASSGHMFSRIEARRTERYLGETQWKS